MVASVISFPNRESGSAEIRKKSKKNGKHPSDDRSYSRRVDFVVHNFGCVVHDRRGKCWGGGSPPMLLGSWHRFSCQHNLI